MTLVKVQGRGRLAYISDRGDPVIKGPTTTELSKVTEKRLPSGGTPTHSFG